MVIALSRSYKPVIPSFKIDRRIIISILVIAGVLLSTSFYYSSTKDDLEFSINDPSGDVSYSGYTDPMINGHENIDILKLESRVMGDSVVLEMELAEAITGNDDAEYSFYISTDKHGLWTDVIDLEEMEVDGNILRVNIPVESLKDRKIFHVLAVASEYDASVDLNLHDNCSNRGSIWETLNIFTS